MIIVGAKGFAKEVLEVAYRLEDTKNLVFYDDVNLDVFGLLYDKFPILKSKQEAIDYFKNIDNRFTIGVGNPILRKKLYEAFISFGGVFTSMTSPLANVGFFGNNIAQGCNIMSGTIITADVNIKKGVLINLNCTIGHDSILGEFVELSPGVHISGNCIIGNYSVFGTNSTLLPKIEVGTNVIIGAGSVVTKNLPDNCVAVGIPAKIIKSLEPLEL